MRLDDPAVSIAPIRSDDVAAVAGLLESQFPGQGGIRVWAARVAPGWSDPEDDHGLMLVCDGRVVGAYVAYRAERRTADGVRRHCHLGPWCVLPEYRGYGLRLVRALLDQPPGTVVTDLTPVPVTAAIDRRLGFRELDTRAVRVVNLPWFRRPGQGRIVGTPGGIDSTLTGQDRADYRAHRHLPGLHHLAVVAPSGVCYVVVRSVEKSGRKRIGALVHVSEPSVFRGACRRVFGHLLLRHGLLVTHLETRMLGFTPRRSFPALAQTRMIRSDDREVVDVDYLYSELMLVDFYM